MLSRWSTVINMYPLVFAWWRQHDITGIARWRWTGVILIAGNLASPLSLSSNDRVSSFYWSRGSKLCFLTSFSYFSGYFIILGFLRSHYLLVSLRLSWLHGNPIFCPVFSNLVQLQDSTLYVHPHISGTHQACFLRTRHLWDPGSGLSTRLISHFRSLPKVSGVNDSWVIAYLTGLSFTHRPQVCTFLLGISLSYLRTKAWARNPQGIFKLVNLGWLLLILWQLLEEFHSTLCNWSCSSWFLALCLMW